MSQITKKQFELIKLFLDTFKVKDKRLAKEWGIDLHIVQAVKLCPNYETYIQIPLEDLGMGLFGSIFNA